MELNKSINHGSLFSGIGGFDLAAQWMGWENVFHCEWNKFGQKVLKHYWPNAISYHDITKTDFTIHRGQIDVLTGGFPCQPYSTAGKRLGKDDDRHLWPEMLRAIREISPRWVVGENVLGLVNWNGGMVFEEVQIDLDAAGYEVQPFILPAAGVGAPHKRNRVWFVAYAKYNGDMRTSKSVQRTPIQTDGGRQERIKPSRKQVQQFIKSNCLRWDASYSKGTRQPTCALRQRQKQFRGKDISMGAGQWDRFPAQSPVCIGDDGLPSELDGITFSKWRKESIKAAGNAVVPQIVLKIFKAIDFYESQYLR